MACLGLKSADVEKAHGGRGGDDVHVPPAPLGLVDETSDIGSGTGAASDHVQDAHRLASASEVGAGPDRQRADDGLRRPWSAARHVADQRPDRRSRGQFLRGQSLSDGEHVARGRMLAQLDQRFGRVDITRFAHRPQGYSRSLTVDRLSRP
jgi:hypothetical protein